MKKILLGLFSLVLVLSFVKIANASLLDDLKREVGELRAQIALLKGSQMATALSATSDSTPRIMYWSGKVNQHIDTNGVWQTDPNGTSGADIDKLTYCKKWYQNTVSVEDYKNETIDTWRAGGNTGAYTSTKMSTKCVQPASVDVKTSGTSTETPTNRIATVSSSSATNLTYNSVTLTGNVTDLGVPSSISARGFCYKAYGQASRTDNLSTCKQASGTGSGTFSLNITGLSPSTSYSFIAYADHQVGPAVSSQRTFTTLAQTSSDQATTEDTCVLSSFNASKTNIKKGESTTLNWATSGCGSLEINPIGTMSSLTGSKVVSPTSTTSYELRATSKDKLKIKTGTTTVYVSSEVVVDDSKDLTPRIMYWSGKVNQHIDTNGVWQTDPDGYSGANIDKLTYCKRWYSNTISVEDYKNETIDTWRAGGNTGAYTSTKMSTKCVQGTGSRTDPINGGWTYWTDSGVCTNGYQKQVRNCTNPTPANGGKNCVGDWSQYISCGISSQFTLNSSASLSEVCKAGFPDFEYLKTNRGSVVFGEKIAFPASSSEITKLQKILSALGYLYGDIDGKYTWTGSTKYSIELFQKNNNLDVSGIAGTLTIDALKNKWTEKCAVKQDINYCSANPLVSYLARGSSGVQVKTLQSILSSLGYLSGTIDGNFGTATYNAVKAYQTANNLSSDGVVGTGTRASLNAKWQEKCASSVSSHEKIKISVIKQGQGEVSKLGDTLSVNYTGKLMNGEVFDSNIDPKFDHVSPFTFVLGSKSVIEGWDKGLVGMKVGEKRIIEISPEYAYGANTVGKIPPNSVLIFEIELIKIVNSEINTPSITVTSPNGGETFKVGDKITVTWKTENIPSNYKDLWISLGYRYRVLGEDKERTMSTNVMSFVGDGKSNLTMYNDGAEEFILSQDIINHFKTNLGYNNLPVFGNYYYIDVSYDDSRNTRETTHRGATDTSDNPFTIASPSTTFVNDYACGLPLTEKLENGMSGGQVYTLQKILNGLGYLDAISVDGKFGTATYNAVRAYQTAKVLYVDGIVGAATRTSLNTKWAEKCVGETNNTPSIKLSDLLNNSSLSSKYVGKEIILEGVLQVYDFWRIGVSDDYKKQILNTKSMSLYDEKYVSDLNVSRWIDFDMDSGSIMNLIVEKYQKYEPKPTWLKLKIKGILNKDPYAYYGFSLDAKEIVELTKTDDNLTTSTPSITVTSPKEGNVWYFGNTYEIKWDAKNFTEPIMVGLISNPDTEDNYYCTLGSKIPVSSGKFVFNLTKDFKCEGSNNFIKEGTQKLHIYNGMYPFDLIGAGSITIASPSTTFVNDYACGLPLTEKLENGMSGGQVYTLQKILNGLGYLNATSVDGKFGTATYNAVRAYQTAKVLYADGIVGAATRTSLNTKWAEKCLGGVNKVGEISVLTSVNNPQAQTLEVRKEGVSDDYLVFAFKLKVNEDSSDVNVLKIPIGVSVSPSSDPEKVIDNLYLKVGNTVYDNYDKGQSYVFSLDDNGLKIKKGETVEVKVYANFLKTSNTSTYYPGERVIFSLWTGSVNGFVVEDINGDVVDTSNVARLYSSTFVLDIEKEGDVITYQCSDGIDNDGDKLIDINDPQCHINGDMRGDYTPSYNLESSRTNKVAACGDTIDNDGDGFIDIKDKGCHKYGLLAGDFISTNSEVDPVFNVLSGPISCSGNLIKTKLYYGSSDTAQVKSLQIILNKLGYIDSSSIDSKYGNNTMVAIRQFQLDNNLTVDGRVGNETMSALNSKWQNVCVNNSI